MRNAKVILPVLSDIIARIKTGVFGMDLDEIDHVSGRLSEINCGEDDEVFHAAIDRFEGLDGEKKLEVANAIVDLKMYEEDVCRMYNTNRTTLMRWQRKGKLPAWRHEAGGKNYLFLDECRSAVRKWDEEHDG